MTVQAKPGGGGDVGWTYVSRETSGGHFIAIPGPTLRVNAGSPMKAGAYFVNALKSSNPPSVGVAHGFGGSSRVALLKLARAAGIDQKKLTIVPFKGANE